MTGGTPIFDMHQHFGIIPGFPVPDMPPAEALRTDLQVRLESMDRLGIRHAAIMPGHSYNASRGLADIRALNEGVRDYGALAPERLVALFATLDPRHGRTNLPEVERIHGMGFRGISWHHRFQGLPMDHPVMFEIVERMDEFGMIAMMHCYAQGDFEAPWRLRRLAERFPRTTFVALDAMTAPENLDHFLGILDEVDNIYIDLTTTTLGRQGLLRAIERGALPRLLFGTNCYSMVGLNRTAALDAVNEAGLNRQERDAILWRNATKLLGLPTQ